MFDGDGAAADEEMEMRRVYDLIDGPAPDSLRGRSLRTFWVMLRTLWAVFTASWMVFEVLSTSGKNMQWT